jgi:acetolactate synthase-1/2/3 large subunit
MATLASFETLVLVDAKKPVAMFGYKDQNFSSLIRQGEDDVWEIEAPPGGKLTDAFEAIETALEKKANAWRTDVADAKNDKHRERVTRAAKENTLRETSGKLTPAAMCGTIAKSQPENCVVVDESLTSGSMYWDSTDAFSPQFTHLTLTGGAIGFGLSAAVGAAVADRSRKVIAFQADGSGLYDCPALWTMARYNLNVCVVICNNSSYNILNIENAMQRVEDANKTNVSKSLTSLGEPTIDWVTMAKSFGFRMATRCDTIESFQMVFQEAMEKNGDGPILVEAVL